MFLIMRQIELSIDPVPAPRMTDSDRWKRLNSKNPNYEQRSCVTRYFAYKTELQWLCKKHKYKLGEKLNIVFFIAMPKSWSEKKRKEHDQTFHKQKPDLDNLIKSVADSLTTEDSFVCSIKAEKRWGYQGKIIIYEETE